jgi:hypothetical protein
MVCALVFNRRGSTVCPVQGVDPKTMWPAMDLRPEYAQRLVAGAEGFASTFMRDEEPGTNAFVAHPGMLVFGMKDGDGEGRAQPKLESRIPAAALERARKAGQQFD